VEARKADRSLDNSPLFLHIVSKLVQALVTYDEIFQALAVEGDLLQKPFLDLSFDCVVRLKLLALEMFFQFSKHVKVQGD
jgi:hypothetical protein